MKRKGEEERRGGTKGMEMAKERETGKESEGGRVRKDEMY